jgi:CRP/FNR family transcriptional regulator, cyclic AMP receptor protein
MGVKSAPYLAPEATLATHTELLNEVPLFSLMEDHEREALAEMLNQVSAPQGQTLFRYGDPGGSLYIVCNGEVELFTTDDAGNRMVLETAHHGDFFGEISLFDGGSRTASAYVSQDLEALRLERAALDRFLQRYPTAAIDMLTVMGTRLRKTSERLRHTATRNVNEEMADKRSPVQRAADWIAEFSGSIAFLVLNSLFFLFWITTNLNLVPGVVPFDPFPFGLLTMAVSLEAIFLSIFLLISQNRQAAKDHIRADIEYDVNLKAELEIEQLHEKIDHLTADVLARLAHLEIDQRSSGTA